MVTCSSSVNKFGADNISYEITELTDEIVHAVQLLLHGGILRRLPVTGQSPSSPSFCGKTFSVIFCLITGRLQNFGARLVLVPPLLKVKNVAFLLQ